MLQFLKFDEKKIKESEFSIISGHESLKFFAKRVWYILFCIYSTIFVAAIDPFTNSPFEIWIFYLGALITGFILTRFVNHAGKYFNFNKGGISLKTDSIKITSKDGDTTIPVEDIDIIKINAMGNLLIDYRDNSVSFPFVFEVRATELPCLQFFVSGPSIVRYQQSTVSRPGYSQDPRVGGIFRKAHLSRPSMSLFYSCGKPDPWLNPQYLLCLWFCSFSHKAGRIVHAVFSLIKYWSTRKNPFDTSV